jgi:hypothetical protein
LKPLSTGLNWKKPVIGAFGSTICCPVTTIASGERGESGGGAAVQLPIRSTPFRLNR